MAHDVNFSVPSRALGRADVVFDVKQDGTMLGTLKVSKGSVVWFPSGTTYGCKMGWRKFDRIMEEFATKEEKR